MGTEIDSSDLVGEVTKSDFATSDLYYKFVKQTTRLLTYEYMEVREEKRVNFHTQKSSDLCSIYDNDIKWIWHSKLAENAKRRMEKWKELKNGELL